MPTLRSIRPIRFITLHFERFFIYELSPDIKGFPFIYALCLSSDQFNYRREVPNLSFLPLYSALRSATEDDFRVVIDPPKGGKRSIGKRHFVIIDGVASLNKRAFLASDLGRITDIEERMVMEKLGFWLGYFKK